MKKELVESFVESINTNMALIKNVIKENLGVEVELKVVVKKPTHTSEQYVKLVEVGEATKKQLTATPLLAQLFKNAELVIDCWHHEEENKAWFSVDVSYEHNYRGGYNGHTVMDFGIDFDNGEVTVSK